MFAGVRFVCCHGMEASTHCAISTEGPHPGHLGSGCVISVLLRIMQIPVSRGLSLGPTVQQGWEGVGQVYSASRCVDGSDR